MTQSSQPRVFIRIDSEGRHEPVEERKNVAVEDEYARHSKFRTTTPIEIGLFLTKRPIFLPVFLVCLRSASCNIRASADILHVDKHLLIYLAKFATTMRFPGLGHYRDKAESISGRCRQY